MAKYQMILRPVESHATITAKLDETVSVILRDAERHILMTVEGLVSDGSLRFLDSQEIMEIYCQASKLERCKNLIWDAEAATIEIFSDRSGIFVTIGLSGDFWGDVRFESNMDVAKSLFHSGEQILISTGSATLTAVILAVMTEWSDFLMSDLSDMLMKDMIYTEVG